MSNKPIISIDVQANSFTEFLEIFEEYNEVLEKQPEKVRHLEAALNSVGNAGSKATAKAAADMKRFTEAFEDYNGALDKQPEKVKKLEAATKKTSAAMQPGVDSTKAVVVSLDKATKATKALAGETKKSDVAMASLFKNSAAVAGGIFEASAGIGGIRKVLSSFGPAGILAGIGVAAAGALGDLTLKSAGSVSNTARTAFGANLGYGEYQNATAQLSPFIANPGALLSNVAAAQWNPAEQGQLGLFGVNGSQSSTSASAAILKSAVDTLRSTHNLMMPQVRFAEQITGQGDNDLISLVNQKPADLNAAITAALNPKLAKPQNVDGSTITTDQKLVASWAASMNTASAKFAQALAPLNPMVTAFGQSVAGFAAAVNKLVQATVGPSASGTPGGPGGPALTAANSQDATGLTGLQARLPTALGGLGDSPAAPSSTAGVSKPTNFAGVMKGFEAAGYSTNFAAAMASQAGSESGFDASHVNITKGQKHAGLFQWSAERRAAILKGMGVDVWKDFNPSDQIKASVWELQNTEKPAASKIAAAAKLGPQYAGVTADKYYERSGDSPFYQAVRGVKSRLFASVGPQAGDASPQVAAIHPSNAPTQASTHPSGGLPPQVVALLKRLAQNKNTKPIQVSVTNSTAARVAVSANAASYG